MFPYDKSASMGVEDEQIVVNPTISEKRTVAEEKSFGGTLLPIFNSFATYLEGFFNALSRLLNISLISKIVQSWHENISFC